MYKSALKRSNKRILTIVVIMVSFCLFGCTFDQVDELVIYHHTYEQFSPLEQKGHNIAFTTYHNAEERYFAFDGDRNLGRFERGGITQVIEGIIPHNYIRVQFDLYIHDKWEGNGLRGNGQDVFIFKIDNSTLHFSSIINTKCLDRNCEASQSFPNIIGQGTNPENAGINRADLLGVCHYKDESGGTKLIKIDQLFPHASKNLSINIAADIKESGSDLCLKSWSLDNLKVTTYTQKPR